MQTPSAPPHEPARQALLARTGLLDTPAESAFDHLVQLAAQWFQVPIALISLIDSERQWFKAKVGLDACETARDISLCGHVVASRNMLVVSNTLQDARFADNPLVTGDPAIRFYAGAPLRVDKQHVIGTLCLIDQQPRTFSTAQQATLQMLADTLCDLIRQRIALRQAEWQSRLLVTINQAQSSFLLDRDLGSACHTILHSLLAMSQTTLGFIASCQDSEQQAYLEIPSIANADQAALQWLMPQLSHDGKHYRLYGFDHLFGQAIADGQALVINQPALYDDSGALDGVGSLLVVPCFFHLSVLGIMVLANRAGGFDDDIVELLTPLSDSIGSLLHVCALEQARQAAEAELARQAMLDPLTGLLNRRAFLERCQHSQHRLGRYQQRFSLLMLDLDHFKKLNDRLGHPAGDFVLKEVSHLLRRKLREIDSIGRWGGEEFCILLSQESETEAMQLATRLCHTLAALPILWQDETVHITASIGVATVHPHGEATDALLARADTAMYQAKTDGRNCVRLAST